jgi:hypothetical protein
VYPIYHNDVYEGSVICGTGYSLCIKGRVYAPIAYADLQIVVSNGSKHSKALRELETILAMEEGEHLTCTSMRELSKLVKAAVLDEIARQQVVKAALNLNFSNRYWSTTVTNVRKMVDLLVKPNVDITTDVPMHPKYLFTSDRVEEVMSAFGHQAPTFMIPNGSKRALGTDDPPKNFLVRTTTVDAAVLDMKFVMENGYITNDVGNLSSKHRDTPLKGPVKSEIWTKLYTLYEGNDSDMKPAADSGVAIGGRQIDDDLW